MTQRPYGRTAREGARQSVRSAVVARGRWTALDPVVSVPVPVGAARLQLLYNVFYTPLDCTVGHLATAALVRVIVV